MPYAPPPVPTISRYAPRYNPWKSFFYEPFMMTATLAAFLILAITLLLTLSPNATLPLPTNTDQGAPITIIIVSLAFLGIANRIKRFSTNNIRNYRLLVHLYILASLSLVPVLVIRVTSSDTSGADWVVPLAALYVSLTCAICAISQNFSLFSYMSMIALAIATVTTASTFSTSNPLGTVLVSLMLLALPMLCSIERVDGAPIPFLESFWQGAARLWPGTTILRAPMRRVMLVIVFFAGVISLFLTLAGIWLALTGNLLLEDASLFSTLLLLLLWGYLFLRGTGHREGWFGLTLLSLVCILAFVRLIQSPYEGYILALLGAAFLYHAMSRFGKRQLRPFYPFELHLDVLALFLVGVIPFVSLRDENIPGALFGLSAPFLHFSLIPSALGAALAFNISLIRIRSSFSASVAPPNTPLSGALPTGPTPAASAWPWLLLLTGFLATWSYSALLLILHIPPLAGMLTLTVFVALLALFIHRFTGTFWSNPLDALALGLALLTLSLSPLSTLDNPSAGVLLLFFALLSYIILFYQRHFSLLFLPTGLALLGLIWLFRNPELLLLLSLIFPFLAVLVRVSRFASTTSFWEWPLLTLGCSSGLVLAATHTFAPDFFALLPFPFCLTLLAVAWYSSAIMARAPWWLFFNIVFALLALLAFAFPFPSTNQLWLTLIVFCFAGTGFFVSLFLRTKRGTSLTLFPYILPLYLTALFAALLTGFNALSPQVHSVIVPDISLLFLIWAAMAYSIALFERRPWFSLPVALFGVWSILVRRPTLNPGDLPAIIMITTDIGIGSALAALLMRRLLSVLKIDSSPRP
ncbi:MAG: hypothetical protein ACRDHZ_10310 [Ktedonobacteraceae bacterium]